MFNGMLRQKAVWIGRVISALVVVVLLADGSVQMFLPAKVAGMMEETGFPLNMAPILGILAIMCAVLYAVPATSVLGAILAVGFFGGAIGAHVRLGELGSPPEIISVVLGLIVWAGLYFRDARIRELLPLTR